MAEMMVAGGILVAGIVPLFGHWVKLTKDTGTVTGRARAFRAVQEVVDRYQAMGPVKLLGLADADGVLGAPAAPRATVVTPAASRLGAALMIQGGAVTAIGGGAGAEVAAALAGPGTGTAAMMVKTGAAKASEKPTKIVARLTREDPLLRLVVEATDYPELKVERLMPLPIEPAAPAWQ